MSDSPIPVKKAVEAAILKARSRPATEPGLSVHPPAGDSSDQTEAVVELSHASFDDYAAIMENGLDVDGGRVTYAFVNAAAAEKESISRERGFAKSANAGLVISRVPKEKFAQLVRSEDIVLRMCGGFSGRAVALIEALLKTPTARGVYNAHIVK
jgi:hypothetical protein